MIYREFNKLSFKPSLLGFGCMRLPLREDKQIDFERTQEMFDLAIKAGVTYFDTAYMYLDGQSEIVVGKILKNYPRDTFTITSKLPVWLIKKEDEILEIFYKQLSKLQVEYLDIYLLHAINKADYLRIKSLNVFDILTKLKDEKKIKHIGFSFHGTYEDFEFIVNDGLKYWDIVQIQLNYMDTRLQQGIRGYYLLKRKGIPVLIMEPVKGGSLSRLPSDISAPLFKKQPDKTISSWAFRWLFKLDGIVTILSGMSTEDQVIDNIKTFTEYEPLSIYEEKILMEAKMKLKSRIIVPCTGCAYCVPCPKGVKINHAFYRFNEMFMFERFHEWDYMTLLGDHKINECVNCGLCKTKCPQSINIPLIIAQIQKSLKTKSFD